MALTDPIGQFGVHSVCFYTRSTGVPIVIAKVIGECNMDFSAEMVDLEGGSQQYFFDSEVGKINSEMSMTLKEYSGSLMNLFLGGTLTSNSAESSGAVDAQANVNGTTIIDESNGITVELTSGDSADLKEGKYILYATGAQTLSLYGCTDVDFLRGTDLTFSDDTLLIESGISCAATVEIEELGIKFTKNGTPAFTTGHTAEFYIRKPNTSSIELAFGQSGAEFSEVGCYIAGQKQSDGTITCLELYKVKGAGFPISFSEKAWSEASVTMRALYDSAKDGVGILRRTIAA